MNFIIVLAVGMSLLYIRNCLMHHSQKQQLSECANMVYLDKLMAATFISNKTNGNGSGKSSLATNNLVAAILSVVHKCTYSDPLARKVECMFVSLVLRFVLNEIFLRRWSKASKNFPKSSLTLLYLSLHVPAHSSSASAPAQSHEHLILFLFSVQSFLCESFLFYPQLDIIQQKKTKREKTGKG